MSWLSRQFELHRGDGAHLAPMEGLRGFAVLLVFLVHYTTAVAPWLEPGTALAAGARVMQAAGNAGVDLFFVLSSALIYGALMRREQPYATFLLRRLRRIYPAYTAVFLLYLLLSCIFPAENKIPTGLTDAAFYLAANYLLLTGFGRTAPMIAVAWSLSYELLYYLLLPLLITAIGLRHRSAQWRMGFFVLLLGLGAAGFALLGGPVRLLMFIAGSLLHESLAPGRGHRPGQAIVTTTLAACIVPAALFTLSLPVAPLLKTAALFCAWYLLCHGCFAAPRTPLARAFAWRPLRWLGNMSFSFYLLHGLVLKAGFYVLALIWPPASHTAGGLYFWTLIPATLLLAVLAALAALASALLFLLVERPLSLAPPGPVQAPLRRRSRRSASPGSRWWGRP